MFFVRSSHSVLYAMLVMLKRFLMVPDMKYFYTMAIAFLPQEVLH